MAASSERSLVAKAYLNAQCYLCVFSSATLIYLFKIKKERVFQLNSIKSHIF